MRGFVTRSLAAGLLATSALVPFALAPAALAQKPPPAGAPIPERTMPERAPQPRYQPPPPPARPMPPPPQSGLPDKFRQGGPGPQAQPAPPPPTPAPMPDKFRDPQRPVPPQQAQPMPPVPMPPTPIPPAPQAPPQQQAQPLPIPPNEPETIARLRSRLAAGAQLGYRSAEVVDPARGSVRLQEVLFITNDGKRVTAEELLLEDLRDNGVGRASARNLRSQEGGTTVTIARLDITGLNVDVPTDGRRAMPTDVVMDSARVENLRVQDAQADVAIAALELEEYGRDRASRFGITGLEVRLPAGQPVDLVRLARAGLRGYDLATLWTALVENRTPGMPTGRQAIEAEELTLSAGGRPMGAMASARISGESSVAGNGGSLALRGIRIEPFPEIAPWLQRFGYDGITADITAEARFNPSNGRLEMPSLSVAARDAGALALSLVLDNLPPDVSDPSSYQQARLVAAGLRYVDQSLFARFVRQQAQESRQQEAQLREQFASMATGMLAQGNNSPALQAIGNAAARFIRGQAREVELVARPTQPVPLADLAGNPPASPGDAVARFGVTATAR